MSTLVDPQSEWASLILSSFADAGVRDVIVSPGSRSTPFVLAAAREPRLRLRSIIDERSAAFFALGQAKASGRPSLLICTSGSAPAHYLPALVEAQHAHTPLLVLSADRPLEAQASDAAQTIDQVKLFGTHVVAFIELGGVDSHEAALAGTKRLVAHAVERAGDGGPVHLNARARKPLEPHAPRTDADRAASARIAAHRARPARARFAPRAAPAERGIAQLAAWIRDEPRGVLVVGPRRTGGELSAPLLALAARAGYPVLADATAGLAAEDPRILPGALSLLGAREGLKPRLTIVIDGPPVASAFGELAAASRLAIIAGTDAVDGLSCAALICQAEPVLAIAALDAALGDFVRLDTPFLASWQRAHRMARTALRARMSGEADGELAAVEAVVRAAGDALLFVGNSLAVRELELAVALAGPLRGAALHQRGASGIDGLVSGAAGAASVGGPTILLLGDVSLLHDLHGLLVAARQDAPLAVVVLVNGGGRIFDTLSIGGDAARALFTTPIEHDLASLARFAGIAHARAGNGSEVAGAIATALAHSGATLIEARVGYDSARALARDLPTLVDVVLEGAR